MKNQLKSYMFVLSLSGLLFAAPIFTNACDAGDVLYKCNQTALNEYHDGNMSAELLFKFQNTYCPAAATSCLQKNAKIEEQKSS